MFLRDMTRVADRGVVSITENPTGAFRIQLLCDGSSVDLMPDGTIALTPRAGRVIVTGNLHVTGDIAARNWHSH